MRGIQRLANASKNLMQMADSAADAAAAKLEQAYAKQMEVARQYDVFADDVAARAEEALDQLNQITNLPSPSAGSEPSQG